MFPVGQLLFLRTFECKKKKTGVPIIIEIYIKMDREIPQGAKECNILMRLNGS